MGCNLVHQLIHYIVEIDMALSNDHLIYQGWSTNQFEFFHEDREIPNRYKLKTFEFKKKAITLSEI